MKHYTLGTNKFLKSVTKVTINYSDNENKPDVYGDIDMINDHFKNLKIVLLINLKYLAINEIVKILRDNKFNKNLSIKSSFDNSYEFTISSENGYALLYDCKDEFYIKYSYLRFESLSENCTTQGDYVIFEYEFGNMWLDFEGVEESHKNYECLDLQIIDKPVLVLHRKFIKTLNISRNIKKKLDFVPTSNLKLLFSSEYDN